MGRSVLPHQAAPVQSQEYRQVLQADVVENLVERPLDESGINGHYRTETFQRQPRGKGDRVLFGDAHVKESFRKLFPEFAQAGAFGHGRGDGHHPLVLFGGLDHVLAEDLGIGRRRLAGAGFDGLPVFDVESPHSVVMGGVLFGRFVSLALGGHDVHQDRGAEVLAVFQGFDQTMEQMPPDRADVFEFERLEQETG